MSTLKGKRSSIYTFLNQLNVWCDRVPWCSNGRFGIDVYFPPDILAVLIVIYFEGTAYQRNSAKGFLSKTLVFKEKKASSMKIFLFFPSQKNMENGTGFQKPNFW